METLVRTVMRNERKTDLLDRFVLAVGVLSLCLALGGTLMGGNTDVARDTAPELVSAV